MLTITDLTKKFGSFIALEEIKAEFEAGDCIALLGPNGSGKTTLIKAVLGLVVPTKGKINLNGKPVSYNHLKEITGYMPQIGRYPEQMTIDRLIGMMLSIRNKRLSDCDRELYDLFEIEKIKHKKLGALSGGTKQKVGAVLAFLFQPEILILDEPTAGLDPYSSSILKGKINRFRHNEKLVIITSHIISELDELVSKVLYLIEGKLHFFKPVETIKEESHEQLLEKALAHIMTTDHELRLSYANT